MSRYNESKVECPLGVRQFKNCTNCQGHICFVTPYIQQQPQHCSSSAPSSITRRQCNNEKAQWVEHFPQPPETIHSPPWFNSDPQLTCFSQGMWEYKMLSRPPSNCPRDPVWHSSSINKPNVLYHALNMTSVSIFINLPTCTFLCFLRSRSLCLGPVVSLEHLHPESSVLTHLQRGYSLLHF